MPDQPIPGRALATRRAVTDIVRAAALGSYGVAGFAVGPFERLVAFLDGRPAGIRVEIGPGGLSIELRLQVIYGVPVAEVSRQVDSAIRHGIRTALGREVDRLAIRVGALAEPPGTPPPSSAERPGPASSDLADSGMDVA